MRSWVGGAGGFELRLREAAAHNDCRRAGPSGEGGRDHGGDVGVFRADEDYYGGVSPGVRYDELDMNGEEGKGKEVGRGQTYLRNRA